MKTLFVILCLALAPCWAQWRMQDSHSTASFRGVHAVSENIAWVSGTQGTILRTTDGGAHWERCATPPDAGILDFRAIWAWNANEAQVMSAGPGELSRAYKTTNGCKTWTEVARNRDKDGFWDGLVFAGKGGRTGILIGDPLRGHFDTHFAEGSAFKAPIAPCAANEGEAAFAASNSSAFMFAKLDYVLVTGGKGGPRALFSQNGRACKAIPLPLASDSESAGAFSVFFRDREHGVVVGGDYKKPDERAGTAVWTNNGGRTWHVAAKLPHGYRSSVSWDAEHKRWIAAGTNGSDFSMDDGKTWQPLDDGEWNATSLPFVVGPKGRIARLLAGKR